MAALADVGSARCSPLPVPMPISAEPASFMIALTSAKSRLMSPGTVIRSEMPCTPCEHVVGDLEGVDDGTSFSPRPEAAGRWG